MTTFMMMNPLQFWNGSSFAYDGEMNAGLHLVEDGDVRFPGFMLTRLAAIPVSSALTWPAGGNPFVAVSFSDATVFIRPPGGLVDPGFH